MDLLLVIFKLLLETDISRIPFHLNVKQVSLGFSLLINMFKISIPWALSCFGLFVCLFVFHIKTKTEPNKTKQNQEPGAVKHEQ